MPGHTHLAADLLDGTAPTRAATGARSNRQRRRARAVATAATGLALLIVIMVILGTWWSFTASALVTSAAHYVDRRHARRGDTPLLMYVLVIYLASGVILGTAVAILGLLVAVLP